MRRVIGRVVLTAFAVVVAAGTVDGQEVRRLRLCADPDIVPDTDGALTSRPATVEEAADE